jgi:hypothetical protein
MSLARLTPEFLSSILRPDLPGRVRDVRRTPIGAGKMAESARLELQWSPPEAGPATVVAKVTSVSPRRRRLAAAMRTYEIEAGFYRDLASRLPVRTPRCHLARYQPRPMDFCLVLEDLRTLIPGEQPAGCTIDDAALALEALARLHATSAVPTLVRPRWLRPFSDPANVRQLLTTCGPRFLKRYGPGLEPGVAEIVRRLIRGEVRHDHRAGTPVAVLHGDFRTDNLMFGGPEVAVLDWQTVALGPVMSDVAYFLGTSLSVSTRREAGRVLLAHYLDCTGRWGPRIGWDACQRDYRTFSYASLAMAVASAGLVTESAQDEEMFTVLVTRCAQQVLDLEEAGGP